MMGAIRPATPPDVLAAPVADAAVRLDGAVRAIEGSFLAAGDILSAAVEQVERLITGLDRLIATVDPQLVEAASGDLTRAAQALLDLPEALSRRRAGLRALVERGDRLEAAVAEMRQSLSYLRVFTVYVKIAAAGGRTDAEQFNAFADEIADCIATGFSHLTALTEALESVARSVRLALALEADLAARTGRMLPATPEAIVASGEALIAHRTQMADAATAVRALAAGVRGRVGRVLAALQVGDSTRQRLEHVRDGLRALDDRAAALPPDVRAAVLGAGRELLGALLSSAATDFEHEVQAIGLNLSGLAADAAGILTLLETVHAPADADQGGFLEQLAAHIGEALDLVGEVRIADEQAAELSLGSAERAIHLLARVDDIQRLQRDVQQMALNTRLKCSRIGADGQSLAVIALELREQATYLEGAAAGALETIRSLEQGARQLAVTLTGADGEARIADRALKGVLTRLERAGSDQDDDARSLNRLGTSAVTDLRAATTGVDFRSGIGQALAEALDAIPRLARVTPLSPDARVHLEAFFADQAASYTMAQERDIHAAVCATFDIGAPPPREAAPPDPGDALDDLLF